MKAKGLKVGFEIHLQLDTGKLFCKCPGELRSDNPDIQVKRKIYAVAGESGKIDVAAAYEESKKRTYIYEGYSDSTCEVEFDEAPPFKVNHEALKTALQIAAFLNAKPLSVTQVMRKTVVDGSNTSGFQRTMLVARGGFIMVNGKKIGIEAIALEEDAARRTAETKDSVTYRLDRLGIPLIEIATAPDVTLPEDAKEVIMKIGDISRSVKVKRGIGTIRQDVNVSIAGGDRTELKGVQEPALIEKAIIWEMNRQQERIDQKEKVERTVRNVLPDGSNKFLRPMPGAARMYPETDLPLVRISDELVKEIKNNLPKLRSEISKDLLKMGLSEEYAGIILSEGKLKEFESLLSIGKKSNPNFIAKMLILFPKDIANKEGLELDVVKSKLNSEVLMQTLQLISSGKLSESSARDVLAEVAKGKDLAAVMKSFKPMSMSDVESEIKKIVQEKPGLSMGGYMGIIMSKYKGKVDAGEISKLLGKLIKK